jgi:hypothetical protein
MSFQKLFLFRRSWSPSFYSADVGTPQFSTKEPKILAKTAVELATMLLRQLFDPQSSTYTDLLADPAAREALLIDPVFEQARPDAALIDELGLKLAWTHLP